MQIQDWTVDSPRMQESPRPEDIGDQRTPVSPEEEEDTPSAADPRSEPGAPGVAARMPLWLIVGGFVIFALVALYLAWLLMPPS